MQLLWSLKNLLLIKLTRLSETKAIESPRADYRTLDICVGIVIYIRLTLLHWMICKASSALQWLCEMC